MTLDHHEYAQSLFGLGGEYLEAADTLTSNENTKWLPTYFLICHSIELSLKSFLANRGYDDIKLRKLGHNITKCLAQAEAEGLCVSLTEPHRKNISDLDLYYSKKELEYFYGKEKTFPEIGKMLGIAKNLRNSVFDKIMKEEFNLMKSE